MTTSFYAPPEQFLGSTVMLAGEEARHIGRVLRKRPGDVIVVVDGAGGWHEVRLQEVDVRRVMGEVLRTERDRGEPDYDLHIALGLLKNRNRFEWFVEKAVELGVRTITPLMTERTERSKMRLDRMQGIAIAAMKQSGRSRLVAINEPMELASLDTQKVNGHFLCHESADPAASFSRHLSDVSGRRLLVAVGPEGGFSDAEVERAQAAGYGLVSLGPRRLRAETAAMVVCTAVMSV